MKNKLFASLLGALLCTSALAANVSTPPATANSFGTIKPDGSSCTVTAGVLSCPGSGTGFPITIGGQNIGSGGSTTNQGNGGKLQLSTGSTTTNDCVKFDSNGNTIDNGSACGSGGTPFMLYDLSARVPALGSMTQVNITGSGSVTQNSGKALSIIESGTSSTLVRGLAYPSPGSTPYRVSLLLLFSAIDTGFTNLGFGWYDGTNKLELVHFGSNLTASNTTPSFQYDTWSTPSTRNTFTNLGIYFPDWTIVWFGLRNDGTNLYWEISSDGANYITIKTETIAASYLGAGNLNYIFFGVDDFGGSHPMALTCLVLDVNGLSRVAGY